MSGVLSAGGLISGIDTATLIEQLVALESEPITRIEGQISALETEKDAVRELRTLLLTLYNRAQDFVLSNVFDQYGATTSEEEVMTVEVSGSNPVVGAYEIEVLQLATATAASSSGELGGAIDPDAALNSAGIATEVTAGEFMINGVTFTIDPDTQSLNDILAEINASAAGVTATYDAVTDTVTFENSTADDTSIINFGEVEDEEEDSNFLEVLNVTDATQSTGGAGSTVVTSTRNLGAIDAGDTLETVNFSEGALTSGTFYINGVEIEVDVTQDSISDVLGVINDSDAGVTASYDTSTDTIRVVSDTLGSRTVKFTTGTSNFLSIVNLDDAVQEAGSDCEFTINGGDVETRNTNEVSDAIGGVTLDFLSEGTSTVKISSDNDAIVEDIEEFIAAYNEVVAAIDSYMGTDGTLSGDSSIRTIENYLWTTIFGQVSGSSGAYDTLISIGISTGDSFDSTSTSQLELDTEELLEALREDRSSVESLFTNDDEDGIANLFNDYFRDVTSTTGFLYARVKSNGTIDQKIESYEDQIERLEARIEQYEERLRSQFTNMELMLSEYEVMSSSLSALSSSYGLV